MARIIPKRVLDEIRFRNDVVDVVGSYLSLKKAGGNFRTLCPFHKEKTPSFNVNPQRQIWHCFGCGKGGDVFSFVMEHEGVSFTDAAQLLARRAGMNVELEDDREGKGPRKDVLYRIHEELAQFYRRCLLQTAGAAKARAYLEKRGIGPELAEEFMIGYAPDRWDATVQWAGKHEFTTEQLETCGLIVRNTREGARSEFYDRFRGRLMFPIRDEQSRVIAFSGRALESGDRAAKYVNSPETPLFRKSRVLYALDRARRNIVEAREAVVCEGQIDVIRCHAAGIGVAVASQGTAFTEEHARVLRRYADSVTLVFDADRAGQDAAVRTAAIFMDAGLAVRVATLPPGEDPDSLILKRGAEAFQAVLRAADSAVRFQVRVLSAREDARSEVGVMRIARAVLQTITHSPNAVQRARLVQEAAEMLNLPPSALQQELRGLQRQARRFGPGEESGPPPGEDAPAEERAAPAEAKEPPPREQVDLCEHAVHVADHPEMADLLARYAPADMLHPVCRAVVRAALDAAAAGKDLHQALREAGADDEAHRFAAAAESAPAKARGEEITRTHAVKTLILALWKRELKARRRRLEEELGARGAPDEPRLRALSVQIRTDLKLLDKWDTGRDVIEVALAEHEAPAQSRRPASATKKP
ncbi:MAG: DNA primase [Lentisphaerae bacterium]|nr:DNA primase [Lentisphaerota bacterium]